MLILLLYRQSMRTSTYPSLPSILESAPFSRLARTDWTLAFRDVLGLNRVDAGCSPKGLVSAAEHLRRIRRTEFRLCFWAMTARLSPPTSGCSWLPPTIPYIRASLLHPAQLDPLRSTPLGLYPLLGTLARKAGRHDVVDSSSPSIRASPRQ